MQDNESVKELGFPEWHHKRQFLKIFHLIGKRANKIKLGKTRHS